MPSRIQRFHQYLQKKVEWKKFCVHLQKIAIFMTFHRTECSPKTMKWSGITRNELKIASCSSARPFSITSENFYQRYEKNSIFENIFVCEFEKSWSLLNFLAFLALISPINRPSTHHKNQLVRIWHRKDYITTHPSRIQHLTRIRMELMEKFIQMVSIQIIIIIKKWY